MCVLVSLTTLCLITQSNYLYRKVQNYILFKSILQHIFLEESPIVTSINLFTPQFSPQTIKHGL